MDYDLVLARNITRAQRMAEILRGAGIPCTWQRSPAEMSLGGCTCAVEVSQQRMAEALELWRAAGFAPLRVWRREGEHWQEVGL